MQLNPAPEIFHAIAVVMNHGFDKRATHRISEDAFTKNCLLKIFGNFFEDIDMGAFLCGFQIQRIANDAKIFYGIKPCRARLIKKNRSDFC